MDKLTLDVSVQYHEDVNMKTIFDELWHIAKYPGAEHRDRETDLVLFFEGAALAAFPAATRRGLFRHLRAFRVHMWR